MLLAEAPRNGGRGQGDHRGYCPEAGRPAAGLLGVAETAGAALPATGEVRPGRDEGPSRVRPGPRPRGRSTGRRTGQARGGVESLRHRAGRPEGGPGKGVVGPLPRFAGHGAVRDAGVGVVPEVLRQPGCLPGGRREDLRAPRAGPARAQAGRRRGVRRAVRGLAAAAGSSGSPGAPGGRVGPHRSRGLARRRAVVAPVRRRGEYGVQRRPPGDGAIRRAVVRPARAEGHDRPPLARAGAPVGCGAAVHRGPRRADGLRRLQRRAPVAAADRGGAAQPRVVGLQQHRRDGGQPVRGRRRQVPSARRRHGPDVPDVLRSASPGRPETQVGLAGHDRRRAVRQPHRNRQAVQVLAGCQRQHLRGRFRRGRRDGRGAVAPRGSRHTAPEHRRRRRGRVPRRPRRDGTAAPPGRRRTRQGPRREGRPAPGPQGPARRARRAPGCGARRGDGSRALGHAPGPDRLHRAPGQEPGRRRRAVADLQGRRASAVLGPVERAFPEGVAGRAVLAAEHLRDGRRDGQAAVVRQEGLPQPAAHRGGHGLRRAVGARPANGPAAPRRTSDHRAGVSLVRLAGLRRLRGGCGVAARPVLPRGRDRLLRHDGRRGHHRAGRPASRLLDQLHPGRRAGDSPRGLQRL